MPDNNTRIVPRSGESQGFEIDIWELLHMLWRHSILLILCLVVGGSAAYYYTKTQITPQYRASASMYFFNVTSEENTRSSEMSSVSQMVTDFQIMATTREILEDVIQELDLGISYGSLAGRVSVTNPSGAHIFVISAVDSDPQRAADISNALTRRLGEQIAFIMRTEAPSILEEALPPGGPISPDVKKNTMIGAVGLFAVACGILVLRLLLKDTLDDAEDVEKYLGLQTLALLPIEHFTESRTVTPSEDEPPRPSSASGSRSPHRSGGSSARHTKTSRRSAVTAPRE